jgi:hypothetical protein
MADRHFIPIRSLAEIESLEVLTVKVIHEAVQKELAIQQMLSDAVREKEVGLRELQKVLLRALYLVNRLLDEIPVEAAARVAGNDASLELEPAEVNPAEGEVAPAVPSGFNIGPLESVEAPIGDSSPRDLP